jgi:hypothetical protein
MRSLEKCAPTCGNADYKGFDVADIGWRVLPLMT